MKEVKGSNGNPVGTPDTKGAVGSKVSNRAVGYKVSNKAQAKAVGTHVLGRMNPDSKCSKSSKGMC
jgi:hypothetical protein